MPVLGDADMGITGESAGPVPRDADMGLRRRQTWQATPRNQPARAVYSINAYVR